MKMRTVKFSPQFLIERLQGKPLAEAFDLPSDAELLGIRYDVFSNKVEAVIRSESFEDAKDAYSAPELPVTEIQTGNKAVVQQELIQKPQIQTIPPPIKLEAPVVNKVQVQPKRSNSIMEEEFSDEQRKILKFSIDGNFLIATPVRFLKDEWEDINEVAQSIGGRWVKGDIISYWEIPLPKKEE
jgi:hypothetical protein